MHFEKIAVSTERTRVERRDKLGGYQLGNPDEGWSLVIVQEGGGEQWTSLRDEKVVLQVLVIIASR